MAAFSHLWQQRALIPPKFNPLNPFLPGSIKKPPLKNIYIFTSQNGITRKGETAPPAGFLSQIRHVIERIRSDASGWTGLDLKLKIVEGRTEIGETQTNRWETKSGFNSIFLLF